MHKNKGGWKCMSTLLPVNTAVLNVFCIARALALIVSIYAVKVRDRQ